MKIIKLANGFSIKILNVQIGDNLFCNKYYLYENDLYVAYISRPLLPDEDEKNHLVFDILGECADYDYLGNVIREEDRKASHAFERYIENRKVIKQKSGWATKTQFWKTVVLEATSEEAEIIVD